jgi:hypothetical protein
MYYTGIHPMTGKKVYVTTDYHEKKLQRALLQYSRPENANLVREALTIAGREDLIGNGPDCLVRPAFGQGRGTNLSPAKKNQKSKGKVSRGRVTDSEAQGKKGKSFGKAQKGKKANITLQNTPKKTTKLDRIFGEDAVRIKREAAKISDGKRNSTPRGGKNAPKGGKNHKKV